MKIAILYICIGKYVVFWKGFMENFEKFFVKEAEKDYFVFTDAEKIWKDSALNVHKIYQENLGWPGNTLKRFEIFLKAENDLQGFDYIYFFNANARCNMEVTAKDILPLQDKKLTVVQHPGFYDKGNMDFDYERNKVSTAYIPMGEGNYYVCGGINGGCAEDYLTLIKVLAKNVQEDEKKGITAKWHDESHLNRYILDRADVRVLPPSYCYPEGCRFPFEARIVILNKMYYINVDKMKKNKGTTNIVVNIKTMIKRVQKIIYCNIFHRE